MVVCVVLAGAAGAGLVLREFRPVSGRVDATAVDSVGAKAPPRSLAPGPAAVVLTEDGAGTGLYAVDAKASGVSVTERTHVDRTRKLFDLVFDGVTAQRLASPSTDDIQGLVDDVLDSTVPIEATETAVTRHRTVDVTLGSTMLTGGREGRTVPLELVEWSIGPVRLVSVPGEAFHALGRAIEDRVAGEGARVLVAGLAPEWHGYLPSPFTDGYEETMSYGRDAVATIAHALTH